MRYGGNKINSILDEMLDLNMISDSDSSNDDLYDTCCEELMAAVVNFPNNEKEKMKQIPACTNIVITRQ